MILKIIYANKYADMSLLHFSSLTLHRWWEFSSQYFTMRSGEWAKIYYPNTLLSFSFSLFYHCHAVCVYIYPSGFVHKISFLLFTFSQLLSLLRTKIFLNRSARDFASQHSFIYLTYVSAKQDVSSKEAYRDS